MTARNRSHVSERGARVVILAYDGVDELDLVSVYAPLAKAANSRSPRFPIYPVLAGLTRSVRGANGLAFETTADISDLERADAVVIPGGPGVHVLQNHAALCAGLHQVVARQTPLYTICSGVFVLARLGLIDGRRVAVHAQKRDALLDLGVKKIAKGYVRDGYLRSIGGASGKSYVKGLEIGYRILEEFCPQAIEYVAMRLETWPHIKGAAVVSPKPRAVGARSKATL